MLHLFVFWAHLGMFDCVQDAELFYRFKDENTEMLNISFPRHIPPTNDVFQTTDAPSLARAAQQQKIAVFRRQHEPLPKANALELSVRLLDMLLSCVRKVAGSTLEAGGFLCAHNCVMIERTSEFKAFLIELVSLWHYIGSSWLHYTMFSILSHLL